MKTAYSYIRFSSKAQELGDSLRRQLDDTRRYCTEHNLKLSETSYQDLGISAFKDRDRASLEDMLSAIKNGSIQHGSVIILESVDRLSRAGIDKTQEIVKSILRHDVEIVSLHDGLHLTKDSLNDLIAVIRLAASADLAHQESVKKAERVKAAKKRQKDDARQGKAIKKRLVWWLSRESDTYKLNENAQYVRKMITLRQQGAGYHKIAMKLNELGIQTRYGKTWSDTAVREMLSHDALYGGYQVGTVKDGKFIKEELIHNYYPPLISYSEFKELQSEYVNRTGGHKKHNHLSGLVRCGHCGSAMQKKLSKRTTKKRTIEYKQWICVASVSGGCEFKNGIRDLDEHIFKVAKHLVIEDNATISEAEDTAIARVDELQSRLIMQKDKLANADGVAFDLILEATERTKAELDSASSHLAQLQANSRDITTEDVDRLAQYSNDAVKFNLHLKKLIQRVVVSKKGNNLWHVKLFQRNQHTVNLTIFRETQRSAFKYFLGGSEDRINLIEDAKNSFAKMHEWEKDYDNEVT
ncbi:recombinase family protein [Vibrio parahaemolyticus]|uniref:recombinase family protein n=1 Tax=Vibrio alginolyticus TaxID=663 RepID=UPI00215C59FD|nr:recombinase family protein [Vibrio alginolyticus]MCR9322163.1 recombinase family protein [Vibrio alginolyticus]